MQQIIQHIRLELGDQYSYPEANTLARIILQEICGVTFADLVSGKISNLSDLQHHKLQRILSRLKDGEPFQYVLGKTEFYGLDFLVGPEVLIPRPETEELVEWVIADNKDMPSEILDIGTGSGCIAIALAVHIPLARVSAWEISAEALEIAEENARRNEASVDFSQCDVLKHVAEEERFDLIVSNPPYIIQSEKESMDSVVVDFEPDVALFVPDHDPLLFYHRIASLAAVELKKGGRLFFEVHSARGKEVCEMLREKGFSEVTLRKDLSGNERMVRAKKPYGYGKGE